MSDKENEKKLNAIGRFLKDTWPALLAGFLLFGSGLTGFITGVANTTGQFVVGICVSEYENGTLLSKVRRDYQFNITSCISNVVADMLCLLYTSPSPRDS